MRYGEELKKLLQPLGIYDLGGASGAELEAVGGELDRVYGALVDAEREAMPLTAESEGLAAWEALLPFVPAYQTTDDRRRAIAALLRIDGRSFTVDAINDTLAGCGIRARAEETGKVMTVRITFPYNRGEPDGLAAIKARIAEILPCHLAAEYQFLYVTWEELEALFPTWEALEDGAASWLELERSGGETI